MLENKLCCKNCIWYELYTHTQISQKFTYHRCRRFAPKVMENRTFWPSIEHPQGEWCGEFKTSEGWGAESFLIESKIKQRRDLSEPEDLMEMIAQQNQEEETSCVRCGWSAKGKHFHLSKYGAPLCDDCYPAYKAMSVDKDKGGDE